MKNDSSDEQAPPQAEKVESAKDGKGKPADAAEVKSGKSPAAGAPDIWLLEDIYPDIEGVLAPAEIVTAANKDVLVVLDTNALLLPLQIGKSDLSKIREAYKKLLDEGRLFVPGRVVREYIKNRDLKLAELVTNVRNKSSKMYIDNVESLPLVHEIAEIADVKAISQEISTAKKQYLAAVEGLVAQIKSWRGNDPVTTIYHELFKGAVVVELEQARATIEKDWAERLRRRIPPGYKDGAKPDTGIGDFLVWLAILRLAADQKKNLIFVTGEEKSDWFIRADNEGVYPRPELMNEYRRVSGGKSLRLSKLADLLSDMDVPADLVKEVREVEAQANSAVLARNESRVRAQRSAKSADGGRDFRVNSLTVEFDYSTYDGFVTVGDGNLNFRLKFSKASDVTIYLIRVPDTVAIARAKGAQEGDQVSLEDFDCTSSTYRIGLGEVFLARNALGEVMAGRILAIKDDTRGAPNDLVVFVWRAAKPGEAIVVP